MRAYFDGREDKARERYEEREEQARRRKGALVKKLGLGKVRGKGGDGTESPRG